MAGQHAGTAFPIRPSDVEALSVSEFTCEFGLKGSASLDAVCRRFLDDANRALVWVIRFRAFMTWCERAEIAEWLKSDPAYAHHACELAATFVLSDDWEFDRDAFRAAVELCPRTRL
jgi:hypothetical protein